MGMPQSPGPAVVSRAYEIVLKRFSGRGHLEIAAVARFLARGHEIHRLALAGVKCRKPAREAARRAATMRAVEAEAFWSGIGARHGALDLLEEYALVLNPAIQLALQREADRMLRDIFDPHDHPAFSFVGMLPPPAHLPAQIPQLVLDIIGDDLDHAASKAGQCEVRREAGREALELRGKLESQPVTTLPATIH